MTCPNCSHMMNYVNLDRQNILHCSHCGASFFAENAINRLSPASAKKLAEDKKSDEVEGREKICPLDHYPLRPLEESEAIPANLTLLQCERCRGVFVFPDDLLKFKHAQAAKIEFFKAWEKPLPALRTVLVVSFTAIILGTVIYRSSMFINRYSRYTQASDLITRVQLSRSGRYLLVYFKTKTPLRSKIIFEDKTSGSQVEKTVSDHQLLIHQLTCGDLNLDHQLWYQIILIDDKGIKMVTDLKMVDYQPF